MTNQERMVIMSSRPTLLVLGMLGSMLFLLLMAILWAVYSKTDVIVSASGVYVTETEITQVYPPTNGEIIDVFVHEGMPIEKNDVVARIDAKNAISELSNARIAELNYEKAVQDYKSLPLRKRIIEQKLHASKVRLDMAEKNYKQLKEEGTDTIADRQKVRLNKAKTKLEDLRQQRRLADSDYQKYKRLFNLPDGAGISGQALEEKKRVFESVRTQQQLAEMELIEIELSFADELQSQRARLSESRAAVTELQLEISENEQKLIDIEYELSHARDSAKVVVDSAKRSSLTSIDEDQYVLIRAPKSGIVTFVSYDQRGEKVNPSQPIIGIVPEGTKNIVQLSVFDAQRALLKEGLPVSVKFNAFPYQQHGVLNGRLSYISTSATQSDNSNPTYKARIQLEKEFFVIDSVRYPLRYGMTGVAEVIVRKRRLIDFVLDPLRKLKDQTNS